MISILRFFFYPECSSCCVVLSGLLYRFCCILIPNTHPNVSSWVFSSVSELKCFAPGTSEMERTHRGSLMILLFGCGPLRRTLYGIFAYVLYALFGSNNTLFVMRLAWTTWLDGHLTWNNSKWEVCVCAKYSTRIGERCTCSVFK